MHKIFQYRFVLILLTTFFASFGLWFRKDLFGFDSYASWVCVSIDSCVTLAWQDAFVFFLRIIPDSLLFFKLTMFLCLAVSVYLIFLILLEFFEERTCWITIFGLLSLGPIMLFEFGKFENELFAYVLILLGFYFFVKKDYHLFVGSWLLSLMFWLWAGYFQTYYLFFRSDVLEHQLFSGLLPLFGLLVAVPFIFLSKSKWVKFFAIVFLIGFLLTSKFWIFFIVFVALGLAQLVEFVRSNDYNLNFLIPLLVILMIGWNVAFIMQQPTDNDWFFIESTINVARDKNFDIVNEWSYGYWLNHRDYNTSFRGGGSDHNYLDFNFPFVALTHQDLGEEFGCEYHDGYVSQIREVSIWVCE